MDMVLRRTEHGLEGLGEKNAKAYEGWRKHVKAMQVGDTLRFSWRKPRSVPFHRLHFVMLSKLFEAQEQFTDPESFRLWLQVGAGHCYFAPGPNGKPVAIPKSINFESMGEDEFRDHHEAVKDFLRSTHATRFLWPLLEDLAADRAMNQLLEEIERDPRDET